LHYNSNFAINLNFSTKAKRRQRRRHREEEDEEEAAAAEAGAKAGKKLYSPQRTLKRNARQINRLRDLTFQ